jgi:hypothetical protein
MHNSRLLQSNLPTQPLNNALNLLGLLLGQPILQQLRCGLHKLLTIDQRQPKQTLHLLNDLGLGRRLKALQLDPEKRLLHGSRGGGLVFFNCGGRGGRAGGAGGCEGDVGDI